MQRRRRRQEGTSHKCAHMAVHVRKTPRRAHMRAHMAVRVHKMPRQERTPHHQVRAAHIAVVHMMPRRAHLQ